MTEELMSFEDICKLIDKAQKSELKGQIELLQGALKKAEEENTTLREDLEKADEEIIALEDELAEYE